MSEHPPADWYPDPEVPGQQRYWDGSQWTEHRAPGQAVEPGATTPDASGQPSWQAAPSTSSAQPWGSTPSNTGPAPDTWLWQSIVATILCCLPAGVAGIVFASQANSAVSAGNYALATQKAKQAKTWTLVSVGIGIVSIVVGFIFVIAVGSSGGGNF